MPNMHEIVQKVRTTFDSRRTQPVEWRRQQLNGMMRMLDEHKEDFLKALHHDLNKSKNEAVIMEVDFVRNEVVHALNNLPEWMKKLKVPKDLMLMMNDVYIKYEPLGVVLVIGAWNYPLQLSLTPVVGALAAGNCVVLKPSEVSEHTAALLSRLCPLYLDQDAFQVVNGGVPETTELLREQFDHIFYTGNSKVAKVIYEAAAKHLTPVTLEMGGKSPVFVDESSDLDLVSRRLVWGKFLNSGQTCVAPDYVLCTPGVQEPLIEQCKRTLELFYGSDPQLSDSFGRMVNSRHFNRVKVLLDTTSARIVHGGNTDENTKYISPTLLVDVTPNDPVMQDEIFGPVLPFITIESVDAAIDFINCREKPLALYVFSKSKTTVERILSNTSSGGVTVNDTVVHLTVISLPFGGVGSSGIGSYHGKYSFETFSHKRSYLVRSQNMEMFNNARYPPYTEKKLSTVSQFTKKSAKSDNMFGKF